MAAAPPDIVPPRNVTVTRIVSFAVGAGLMAFAISRMRDPHRTALPFGTADLSSVRRQLAALPDSERALVVGYVRRSGGDVLPPKFADPDEPLTARTFAEAIALQRRFLAGQAVVDAQVAERRRVRDVALAPLRAALEVELVERAIVPRGRLWEIPGAEQSAYAGGTKQAIDDTPILVTTYRVRNAADRAMASLNGRVDVFRAADRHGPPGSGRLGMCFLDHRQSLSPGQTTDIRCANTDKRASADDSAYVAIPAADLVLEWTPMAIVFADGTSLEYRGD